jgi:predicted transcriptional regulator of viral defense system
MIKNIKISEWLDDKLASGNYSFKIETIKKELPLKTDISIKRSLSRYVKQKKIISVVKGFYIIIPPAYKNMGILPPIMFIDSLMNFMNRPYYVSLLSAAAIYGAAHQQPQMHYICTTLPSIRATKKNGIIIKYISKRSFSNNYIIKKKTESGYVNVSNPMLTCLDLINYHKTIGGINRAATIINELSEEISVIDINDEVFSLVSKADMQRLGYIWEYEVDQPLLADQLYKVLKDESISLRSYKLINNKTSEKETERNRWKINVNTMIQIDE